MGTQRHRRRSIRLSTWDYRHPSAYFVTIVTRNRRTLFGRINNDRMVLNRLGRIVHNEWLRTAELRAEIELDAFVVMPNHLHGIIVITRFDDVEESGTATSENRAQRLAPLLDDRLYRPPRSLGSCIAGFKSATTRRINEIMGTAGMQIWQRNYYEHIVRTDRALDAIREYIDANPINWHRDQENPDNTGQRRTSQT